MTSEWADDAVPWWARETPRRRFASPYGWRDNLTWLRTFLLGPTARHRGSATFAPQDFVLHDVTPAMTVAFVGDVMPMGAKRLEIGPGLRRFLADADYLVVNLEGVIAPDRRVLNALRHSLSVLDLLADLFAPTRTIVGCANNHAADGGLATFQRTQDQLRRRGFRVLGQRDQVSTRLAGAVRVAAATAWSNQPCAYVSRLTEVGAAAAKPAELRILMAHWGHEMHLYPRPSTVAEGRGLLRAWDLVVGHHSHCPQPVSLLRVGDAHRLIAFSLGDFCYGAPIEKAHHGIVLKTTLGSDAAGAWRVGRVRWRFTRQRPVDRRRLRVEIARACRYFPALTAANRRSTSVASSRR